MQVSPALWQAGTPCRCFKGHTLKSHGNWKPRLQAVHGQMGDTKEGSTVELIVEIIPSINKVASKDWNACAHESDGYTPFVRWEFLQALEESGSVAQSKGWMPQHMLVKSSEGELLGCSPLYLKGHSYGEYVFDHQWAEVAHYMGDRYYPKLQSCVPFTPVTGSRMLTKESPFAGKVKTAMAQGLKAIADSMNVSSLHVTFNTSTEFDVLESEGFISRTGMQYHWQNRGYETFNDFLLSLKQSRRKTIKQERKCLDKHGLKVERLYGDDIKAVHWDNFYKFYLDTCYRKWGEDYLTRDFFHRMGDALGNDVLLLVAVDSFGDNVAGALNYITPSTIFGRVWGKRSGVDFKNLHFELSYYQALDVAIEEGIPSVEAGAQGTHKIQRGYLPSTTFSSHYVRLPKLHSLVEQAMRTEKYRINGTIEQIMKEESPYKQ